MSKKKVLIIAEELSPYTFENDIANLEENYHKLSTSQAWKCVS